MASHSDILTTFLGQGYDQYYIDLNNRITVSDTILIKITSTCIEDHLTKDPIQYVLKTTGCTEKMIHNVFTNINILDKNLNKSLHISKTHKFRRSKSFP